MLEAIACGVPVVANKIEQVTDIWIINGVNGFTSRLSPTEFADKIQKAVEIDERTLDEASKQILAQASSEVIDQLHPGPVPRPLGFQLVNLGEYSQNTTR